jgi:hypothetical protein
MNGNPETLSRFFIFALLSARDGLFVLSRSRSERAIIPATLSHSMSGGHAIEIMDVASAEAYVIDLLRAKGPLGTMEIEKRAKRKSKRCPDQTVLFLAKMKRRGLIEGDASLEKKGWVWWVQ